METQERKRPSLYNREEWTSQDWEEFAKKIERDMEEKEAREHQRVNRPNYDEDDSFVTTKVHQLTMSKYHAQLQLAKAGGKAWFDTLFTLDGKPIKCRFVSGVTGNGHHFSGFKIFNDEGEKTGWVPNYIDQKCGRLVHFAKYGVTIGQVRLDAWVKTGGSGQGMAGLWSCYTETFACEPWSKDAIGLEKVEKVSIAEARKTVEKMEIEEEVLPEGQYRCYSWI